MTVIVNLYGSSGSGKSTTAMGLTYFLKLKGYKVEYVTEYAKDLVNEGSQHKLKYQLSIFSEQLRKVHILLDKGLDFIITDSPLLLGVFYDKKYKNNTPYLEEVCYSYYNSFLNFDVFLKRVVPFDPALRIQTEEESDEDSIVLERYLAKTISLDMIVDYKENRVENIMKNLLIDSKKRFPTIKNKVDV